MAGWVWDVDGCKRIGPIRSRRLGEDFLVLQSKTCKLAKRSRYGGSVSHVFPLVIDDFTGGPTRSSRLFGGAAAALAGGGGFELVRPLVLTGGGGAGFGAGAGGNDVSVGFSSSGSIISSIRIGRPTHRS